MVPNNVVTNNGELFYLFARTNFRTNRHRDTQMREFFFTLPLLLVWILLWVANVVLVPLVDSGWIIAFGDCPKLTGQVKFLSVLRISSLL